MGANGAFSNDPILQEGEYTYKEVDIIEDNIRVLEQINPKAGVKTPEESHTPNRIYVAFSKKGEINAISKYGPDHKKIFDIHTASHHLGAPHYHMWKDGRRVSEGTDLTPEMKNLINKVLNYKSKR